MESFKIYLPESVSGLCVLSHAALYFFLAGQLEPEPLYLGYLALLMPVFLSLVYLYDCKYGDLKAKHHKYHLTFPLSRETMYWKEIRVVLLKPVYWAVLLSGYGFILLWLPFGIFQFVWVTVLYTVNTLFLVMVLVGARNYGQTKDTGWLSTFFYLNFYYSFVPVFLENLNLGFYSPFGAMYLSPVVFESTVLKTLPLVQVLIIVGLLIFIRKKAISWVATT